MWNSIYNTNQKTSKPALVARHVLSTLNEGLFSLAKYCKLQTEQEKRENREM
jgi:hypothetical protein